MSRHRPTLWQYVSFSRPSSRFSDRDELPLRGNGDADPYEKRSRGGSGLYSPPSYNSDLDLPAWRTPGQRSRYLKLGGALALVLLVLYVLLPGEKAKDRQGQATMTTPKEVANAIKTSLTTKCTKPYDSLKDLIQYALMIDAGSTGSRIHVYRFNNCGPTPELEDELFKQTEKKKGGSGLSSYDSDAEGAAASLDVLLDAAIEEVPKEYRSCSPVAVKATAGLRKLGEEKSDKILKAVRRRLETKYPFPVLSHERGGVEVMEGTDEGVYAWITVNYLLGKIGGPDKNPTAAVLDLGGGSTQIVLEPTFPKAPEGGMPQQLEPGDHRYELDFGARNFTLYQHSYLGYGLMAAREAIHQVAVLNRYQAGMTAERNREPGWEPSDGVDNPCIQPGQSETVTVPMPKDHALGESVKVEMRGVPGASPEQCMALVQKMLHKEDVECKLAPCSFNGVYQPSLRQVYAREQIYLFSYFYDRLEPLGMPESFTLDQLTDITSDVCAGQKSGRWDRFAKVSGALDELNDRPEHCLDLSYIRGLLTYGYDLPADRTVNMAKKINDLELGWCLGASLPLLDGNGWTYKPRPRECFDEVLALVLTSLEQPSTHPSSSLFEDNAAHDTKELCDAMHDWLNWKIVRHDISSQHVPDNLIEQASFTLGALNPGQRVAFVVYYGGTGSETHTLFLRTSVIASFLLILDSANLSLTNNVLNGAQQDYYYIVRGHETYPPSNPEDPRDCFSFTARLTKCLAHLALPSWKQAKQLAFSALDIASAMMRDKEQLFKLYAGGPRSRSHVPAEDRFLFCTLFSSELLMASQKGLVLKEPIEVDYDTGEYSRVMVYLISFVVTDIRDLDNELQALTDVLANKLHYTVIRYGIDGRTRQQLLASVNELAERLVQNYGHDPQCLLYLLFAGHGGGDATTGDLLWSGKPSTQSINLTQLQEYLCANLQCHLLLQYDMCNGGYAARTKQDATEILRPFPSDAPSQELLLACGIRETCPMGHESFTKDTIRDLWRCLDHDTPMTLDVLARLSQMQNMSSTASRIRIRLLGPRPIEIYPSVNGLHDKVSKLFANWSKRRALSSQRCRVAVAKHDRGNRVVQPADVIVMECRPARTVKYVLQWYKRRVQIPPHSAVSLRQGREFPTLDDRLINILRSPDRVLVLEAYLDVHFAPQIPDTESDASDAADEDSQQSGTKPQGIETSDVELVEVDDDPTLTVANQATQQDQTQPFIVVDDSGSTSDSNSWDEQAADDGAGSEDASSQDDSDNDLNEASGESEIDELEELKDPPGSIWA